MNENEKILTAIVTYNPEVDMLIDAIDSVMSQSSSTLVIDNHSDNISNIRMICARKNIILIAQEENTGVAGGLNLALSYAKSNGYKYLLALNQDSIAPQDLVKTLIENFSDDCEKNLGMAGPYIHDTNILTRKNDIAKSKNIKLITSGSICDVGILTLIGGYDQRLFMDYVDYDISFRLIEKGFETVLDPRVKLIHTIGNRSHRRILNRDVYPLNHSATRNYYMARGHMYVIRRYKALEIIKPYHEIWFLIRRIVGVLLFEKDRARKLAASIRGLIAGARMQILKEIIFKNSYCSEVVENYCNKEQENDYQY